MRPLVLARETRGAGRRTRSGASACSAGARGCWATARLEGLHDLVVGGLPSLRPLPDPEVARRDRCASTPSCSRRSGPICWSASGAGDRPIPGSASRSPGSRSPGARRHRRDGLSRPPREPSQGSHFFQNLTSFQVGYFTVNPRRGEGFVDWDWLAHSRPFPSAARAPSALRAADRGRDERPAERGRDLQAGHRSGLETQGWLAGLRVRMPAAPPSNASSGSIARETRPRRSTSHDPFAPAALQTVFLIFGIFWVLVLVPAASPETGSFGSFCTMPAPGVVITLPKKVYG